MQRANEPYRYLSSTINSLTIGYLGGLPLNANPPQYIMYCNFIYQFDGRIPRDEYNSEYFQEQQTISAYRYKITTIPKADIDKKLLYYLKRPVS